MDNTDTQTSPEEYSVFVSFAFKGRDNGVEKQGYDSRVIKVPTAVKLSTAEDLKEVTDALAQAEFSANKRYAGLEITLINLVKLPL